ncbi:MAG: sigma-70 family RNA polymerase sigma factor [Deltaproteobacteria bacterium]|nr:sigma-70 family RNA polymerase sigma factor [Deltaproteobacteria bacterium]
MNETGTVENRHVPDPETWVDQYGDYLYRFALSRLRDRAAAEDLVQETFLAALHARENFKGRSSVTTWLSGILKHKIIDHFRKESREQPVEDVEPFTPTFDDLFDEKGKWKIGPSKWTVSPLELYEQKEFWRILALCLSELSDRLARIFTLRELEELSTKEICKVFDISATNCWVMLYRARMLLRRCLEINWFSVKTYGGK